MLATLRYRASLKTQTAFVVRFLLLTSLLLVFTGCGPNNLPKGEGEGQPSPTPDATALAATAMVSKVPLVDDGKPLPPQIIERLPGEGQAISSGSTVRITFDQPMNTRSVEQAWKVTDSDGKAISGKFSWPSERSLQFTPAQPWKTGTQYRVSLGADVQSAQGVKLDSDMAWDFTTVGDLQVDQVFPKEGAQNVQSSAVITVIFNRPVAPLVAAEEQAGLPQPITLQPDTAGTGEWVNTSVYTFRPEKALQAGVEYTVVVQAGLADATGDSQLAQDYSWSFTTAAPDIQFFELSKSHEGSPSEGRTNVLLDEFFTFTFLQPMDAASTESALSLNGTANDPVELTTDWNEAFTTLIVTPTQRLAVNTAYTLALRSSAQAQGGGSLKSDFQWSFTTLPLPGIASTVPVNNDTQTTYNSELTINFLSPMRIDSLKDKVIVEPAPEKELEWWFGSDGWQMSTYSLQPSTRYTVRLLPGMEDVYGNKIEKETVLRFTTAARDPFVDLQMPYMAALYRPDGPQEFFVYLQNVRNLDLKLFKLSTEDFLKLGNGKLYQWQYSPAVDSLVWELSTTSNAGVNERQLRSFAFTDDGKAPLSPGFYLLTLDSPQVKHPDSVFATTRLVMVATSNLTFKTTQTEGMAWLTGMTSGQPTVGKEVEFYDGDFQLLARGMTDEDGLVKVDLPKPVDPWMPRYALSQHGEELAFASSDWGSGASPYDYGIMADHYSPVGQPVVYVYSDRPLYRPGQPVYFKGVIRVDDDLLYHLPETREVQVSIESFEDKVFDERLPLTEFGSFSGELSLPEGAALGAYSIMVRWPESEDVIGFGSFSVAEYRKPEYQLEMSANPDNVLAGQDFTVNVAASYFSGGPVANAPATWSLVSAPFTFSPPTPYTQFSFYDDEMDAGPQREGMIYDAGAIEASGEGQTDGQGNLAITLPADLSKYKTSRVLTVEANISDLSGAFVSGRTDITAHKALLYGGIRSKEYLGEVGKPQGLEAVVLDWDGQPVSGQSVTIEVVERRWHSVQEQDAQGNLTWKSSVEDIPVIQLDGLVTGPDGLVSAEFTPPNGGVFQAKVKVVDAQGNSNQAATYLWVPGEDYVPWRQSNDRSFQLVANQDSYLPGDTAELLIASPYQGESYALVTTERGHIRSSEVVKLENNSTVYRLPITSDLAPNLYVTVVIVKGVDDTNLRPSFRVGMAEIKVDPGQQTLTVNLTPDKTEVGPGDAVQYTVQTLDAAGQPVQAEVSLGLSDLASLSLAEPNSGPILEAFYNHRALNVWTAVPLVASIEEFNASLATSIAEGSGAGSGGGKGGGELGVVEVRGNFPDTAFWEADVVTDESGTATVNVTLPDNLTTWRMDARAISVDTRVGQSTFDILASKPLLVRPQTPRFFVVGDRARLSTAVHNNTDQDLSVTVTVQAKGISLEEAASQQVDIAAHSQALAVWNGTVDSDAERVDLIFRADGGGYSDASRPTLASLPEGGLPVYRFEALETVGTSGQLLEEGTLVEALRLPEGYSGRGNLTVRLAPSLAAGVTDGLDYLENFPYQCTEQTLSRFLPNLMAYRALSAAGVEQTALESNLNQQLSSGLQILYNAQNTDGGWGWWSNEKSDPQTTAYVVLGLVEAKEGGYGVDEVVLQKGIGFLDRQRLTSKSGRTQTILNRYAFIQYVLARSGNAKPSELVKLYEEERQRLSSYGRAFLAEALYRVDAGDPRLNTLLTDFNDAAVVSASGTHWEEEADDRENWNTDTRTTAIILSTLVKIDPKNPLNANAVRWLMNSRTRGHWKGTQETAWSLMALSSWMQTSGDLQASYEYAVGLNGERLGGGVANASTLQEVTELKVDLSKLLTDEANRLAVARTAGSGNLYYTAHLNLSLPVSETEALDQGIVVARSYYPVGEDGKPAEGAITEANQGDLVMVRVTVVAPSSLHHVVVDDPLPAGLEAVDQSFKTSPQAVQPNDFNWDQIDSQGWGWWYFTHIELRDERAILSAEYLPAGTYVYTYLARAATPGTFQVIPTTAQEFYFPEVYGRGAGSLFTVQP